MHTSGTFLYGLIVIHDSNVDDVQQHQDQCFVPFDTFIVNNTNENGHRNAVRQTISCKWPPIKRHHLCTKEKLKIAHMNIRHGSSQFYYQAST